jgi:hypothetical protein
VSRKSGKRRERPAEAAPADGATVSLLPMEIQVGDRLMDQDLEWEVVTHPAVLHGGKSLRARIQRPGLPESEREITWSAHERVEVRRGTTP